MRFIRKKNLHEVEELLYIPRLHGMFIVKPMIWSLLCAALVFIFFSSADVFLGLFGYMIDPDIIQLNALTYKYVLLGAVIVVSLLFLWSLLRYLCTEYGLTNRRLMLRKGVLRVHAVDIATDRIESISCTQGIAGRIFNYGTLRVSAVGGMMTVFYMISKPYAFRRRIVETIEKNKLITVVQGNLPKVIKPKKEKESMYRYGSFVRVIQGRPE